MREQPLIRVKRFVIWGLAALILLMLSGWLLADRLTPRAIGAPSHALPVQVSQTALDREIAPLVDAHDGMTGAILMPDGLDAFAARALSARQAGRSLDLQYYIWNDDLVGHLLSREAWQAAERGVRVRILLDDLNGKGNDAGLMFLDAHPNIEIRAYNPFRNRGGLLRVLEMAQRVFSINHRMHNKAWIADGRVAVLGGRNIGDEYFDASAQTNFRDLDVVLFGPKVSQASAIFDDYWNSQAAVPISALGDASADDLERYLTSTQQESLSQRARVYLARMERSETLRAYAEQRLTPHWSHQIEVVSDPPLKWKHDARGDWLVTRLVEVLSSTRQKALLISPYFVPGEEGTRALVGMVKNHRAYVGVITNSLAANDVPAVHAGYSKYRRPLLAGGVHLHEVRASPSEEATGGSSLFGSSGASLHTKAFLVDDHRGFIGSFNLDPRSAYLNTEMGVLFDDAALAAALRAEYLRLAQPSISDWAFLDNGGELRWLDRTTVPAHVVDHEPGTRWWQRAMVKVLGWLPIESQL
ncbi:MAG: phospholipase D family protein [Thermomonas sp.]